MRLLSLALLAAATAALSACSVACTEEARSSVTVTVVWSNNGDLVDDENLTVTWESADDAGDCELLSGTWACGWEVQGDITVTAEIPGQQPVSETVTVEHDGCHVINEAVTLTLLRVG